LEAVHHLQQRFFPGGGNQLAASAHERRRGAVWTLERRQRLPPLGARHPEIDGVVDRRRQADGLALPEVDVQAAARRTESADHAGGLVGRQAFGHQTQAEAAGLEQELAGQWAVAADQQLPAEPAELAGELLHLRPPGMREAGAARKNRVRSAPSPSSTKSSKSTTNTLRSSAVMGGAPSKSRGSNKPPRTPLTKRSVVTGLRSPSITFAMRLNTVCCRSRTWSKAMTSKVSLNRVLPTISHKSALVAACEVALSPSSATACRAA